MSGIGGPEILVVFVLVLLVFGPKKIPEVARALGKGLREFRKLSTELQREIHLADPDAEVSPPRVTGRPDRRVESGAPGKGETAAPSPTAGTIPRTPGAPEPDPDAGTAPDRDAGTAPDRDAGSANPAKPESRSS